MATKERKFKVVRIVGVSEELYNQLKDMADDQNIKLSSFIKMKLLEIVNQNRKR